MRWTAGNNPGFDPIKYFASPDGTFVLEFPASHLMMRWEFNKGNFDYLGRFGDETTFKSLPSALQTEEVANAFGGNARILGRGAAVVCGSPYEAANVFSVEHGIQTVGGFDLLTR